MVQSFYVISEKRTDERSCSLLSLVHVSNTRCNRSGVTLFLYAPEIFWSSRTVERKWLLCVLVTSAEIRIFWPELSRGMLTSSETELHAFVLGMCMQSFGQNYPELANALVVLSSTAEDGEIEVRISA
ncbi:unnamed protein product, partial [Timema podura]|nr:unnamed protein product [Timema podura]